METNLKETLKQSAINRAVMLEKFGFIPHSIIKIARAALSREIFIYQREVPRRHSQRGEKSRAKHRRLQEAGYRATQTASARRIGRGFPGASIMPAELVMFLCKYYAKPGEVYIDPFMGQGVRMQVAKLFGMHYYGYDISHEFLAYIKAIKDKIDDGTTDISITLGDSRRPKAIPDGIGDFCFTSPPYWNIEYYGDEPEQLGGDNSYEDFMKGMEEVARAWLPKFKPGAWCVINVNDFRIGGKFYAYHADVIQCYQTAGFVLDDLWVVHGVLGQLPKAFAVSINMKQRAPKIHEYLLVFKRP